MYSEALIYATHMRGSGIVEISSNGGRSWHSPDAAMCVDTSCSGRRHQTSDGEDAVGEIARNASAIHTNQVINVRRHTVQGWRVRWQASNIYQAVQCETGSDISTILGRSDVGTHLLFDELNIPSLHQPIDFRLCTSS